MCVLLTLFLAGKWSVCWFVRQCDRANRVDWGSVWLNRVDGFVRLFCRRYHRLQADVVALPSQGGAIIVSNHVSGLDPLLIIAACDRPLRFLIAREQYERFGLQWLFRGAGCIPVERSGRPELAFRSAIKALRRGEVVAIFPEGGIQVPGKSGHKFKSGAVRLAYLTGVPIVPVYLEGVRGVGQTLLAVVLRSRVRMRAFLPMFCGKEDIERCSVRIRSILAGRPVRESGD